MEDNARVAVVGAVVVRSIPGALTDLGCDLRSVANNKHDNEMQQFNLGWKIHCILKNVLPSFPKTQTVQQLASIFPQFFTSNMND